MRNLNSRPRVLYRYQDSSDKELFAQELATEFDIVFCQSDTEAEQSINDTNDICAILVGHSDKESVSNFPIFKLAKSLNPKSLRVLLSNDINLDTMLCYLETGVISQFYSKPYDFNLIRSNIFMAHIGLKETYNAKTTTYTSNPDPHILIVDDEPTALKYLVKQLMQLGCGYKILSANNALEALELIKAQPSHIAVIITDQRMPGMLGHQLLNEIKQTHPNIARVLTSAYGEVNVALGAVNEGRIFQYLKKPWDAKEVLQCINDAVSEHNNLVQRFYAKQLGVSSQYEEIIRIRQHNLESALTKTLGNIAEQDTLKYFFDSLANIETSVAKSSNLRASTETALESLLVSEFDHAIQQKLSKLNWEATLDIDTLQAIHYAIDNLLTQPLEAELPAIPRSDTDAFIHALLMSLKTILSSSGNDLDALILDQKTDGMIITSHKPVTVYKHLLSPLTHTSEPLINQQSSLLMLTLLARKLGGSLKLEAAKQSFQFSLYLTCQRHLS